MSADQPPAMRPTGPPTASTPQRSFLIEDVAVPTGNTDVTVVQASSLSRLQLRDHPMVVCSWEPDPV
jgi:hypothetical protein